MIGGEGKVALVLVLEDPGRGQGRAWRRVAHAMGAGSGDAPLR